MKKNNVVGILGGGQLALILGKAAHELGLRPLIYCEDEFAPASQLFLDTVIASIEDQDALASFLAQCDLVTFENEFIDCQKLIEAQGKRTVKFYPSLEVISILQDKLSQKYLWKKLQIDSSPFWVFNADKCWVEQLQKILSDCGGQCVLKWSKFGYDGKGVFFATSSSLLSEEKPKLEAFFKEAKLRGSEVYAEEKVPFVRELALIAVRSVSGEILFYPPVISQQKEGICFKVYGPASSFNLSSLQQQKIEDCAGKIAQHLDYVGTFALELFETEKGGILINEVAPRVHNSGHYTQNACGTDQFTNHFRALLNWPLGEILPRSGFAMVNLLGPEILAERENSLMRPTPSAGVHLHWYHKGKVRPGRKMGHLNGSVERIEDLPLLLEELELCQKNWQQKIMSEGERN